MAPPVLFDTLLKERSGALLQSAADYRRYARHLSSKLYSLRRRLKVRRRIPTKSGKAALESSANKYNIHVPTADELNGDKRFAGLLMLTAERAWAQAMETKASLENNIDGASGKKRHVMARLKRAHKLVDILKSIVMSTEEPVQFLDYEKLGLLMYSELLSAAVSFEARNYEQVATNCATAYIGLSGLILSLATSDATDDDNDMADLYRDLLTTTVEPSLKFSASQLSFSARGETVVLLSRHYFPKTSPVTGLVESIVKDKTEARELLSGSKEAASVSTLLSEITWRSHTAQIKDATVAAAIVASLDADKKFFAASTVATAAAGFDPVLLAWQGVVDAVHESIVEATSAAVERGQERVQELYIVSTYANYNLISRRIARDNLLVTQLRSSLTKKQKKLSSPETAALNKSVISKVKGITGMYDAILQSVSQINELPGVAADEELTNALAAVQTFYQSLRTGVSAIAVSPSTTESVALWKKASDLVADVDEMALNVSDIEVDRSAKILFTVDIAGARKFVATGLSESQACFDEAKARRDAQAEAELTKASRPFVIDALNSRADWIDSKTGRPKYVDLSRLVDLENILSLCPVPAKPVFFDTAFNFISYEDGIALAAAEAAASATTQLSENVTTSTPEKKGWFWKR
ncbi:hypothetical protein V1512DRAFT_266630 [Lipomyces arxii]|uniref:uncharacterized protein n=1 Tax=Lipomyces arxii TaxID=56418 RepID=UPI0034CD6300